MFFRKNLLVAAALSATFLMSCTDEVQELETTIQGVDSQLEIANRIPQKFQKSNFYTAPIGASRVQFTGTTTGDLNRLINQQSDENGPGVIIEIPKANYRWNRVVLKSNIHLEIEGQTKIVFDGTRGSVFSIGASKNGSRLKNISISGKNKQKFTVDISADNLVNQNVNVLKIGRVDNFRFGDINIKDRRSSVNSIVLVHVPGASENRPGPKDGVIENIRQTGAHTGYGLVQTYNAENVLFTKISCEGGITLRMETDDKGMKNELKDRAKEGGIKDIFAYDIKNNNGLCAVMFSPHFVENGKVTVEKVSAIGSAFAVRIEKGFLELFDKNRRFPLTQAGQRDFRNFIQNQFPNISGSALSGNPYKRNNGTQWATRLSSEASLAPRNTFVADQLGNGLKAGYFTNSKVSDIRAIYQNDGGAKIKQGHLKFIPCDLWNNDIKNPGTSLSMFNGFEYHGPSVSLSIDNTNNTNGGGNYKVRLSKLKFNRFPNGFTKSIKLNTAAACNNNVNTIQNYNANFPN